MIRYIRIPDIEETQRLKKIRDSTKVKCKEMRFPVIDASAFSVSSAEGEKLRKQEWW